MCVYVCVCVFVCVCMCVCVCVFVCVTKRRDGESCGQESRMDILMSSLKALLHFPHLMGFASP